ncbi:MAG: alpha/beta hydrolase, partial [Blautia wexlerae]
DKYRFILKEGGVFMEKRKLVLTIIGVVILAMVIMVYIYFLKPGRDEKKNQQTINQVQTVQQKTDEKKENTEKNTSGDELENVTPGSDEYYGSEPFKEAYQQIHELYKEQGLSESEIDKLVVLDVKDKDYFEGTPVTYQHGGGYLFCRDKEIMGWLFNQ